ncbi:MAG TPA: FeoA family protein [Candidatus Limnocylindrales bacterium]
MDPQPPASLDRLPVGSAAIVVSVAGEHRAALTREGVVAGQGIVVEEVAPFGGPLVLGVGRARLALARSVARTIEVRTTGLETTGR